MVTSLTKLLVSMPVRTTTSLNHFQRRNCWLAFAQFFVGALQNLSGRPVASTYVATNAQIAPSLGRNLAACGAAVTCTASAVVTIMEPNTVFEDRYTLLDLRLGKTVRVGRLRMMPRLDVYNLLNSDAVNSMITRYGTTWLRPQEVFGARFFKLGVQVDF